MREAGFTQFNERAEELVAAGVRWVWRGQGFPDSSDFPEQTFSKDLEPEYIALSQVTRLAPPPPPPSATVRITCRATSTFHHACCVAPCRTGAWTLVFRSALLLSLRKRCGASQRRAAQHTTRGPLLQDAATAYVVLQENNAIAVVDVAAAEVTSIQPLTLKAWADIGARSDLVRGNGATLQPWNHFGAFQPDTIVSFSVNGKVSPPPLPLFSVVA